MTKEEVLNYTKECCKKYCYPEEAIENFSEESWINKDLGLDELDFVELIMDIEIEFNIHIDDSNFNLFGNDYQIKDILNNVKELKDESK